ncbi:MAG: hypothetical protein JW940_00565 [Polyangiaceae bacterium]|nr:hypothetical protein [Polyangiaceae bacterium]
MAEARKAPVCPQCGSEDTKWIPYGHTPGLGGHDVIDRSADKAYRCRGCGHAWGELTDYNFAVPLEEG